MFFAIAKRTSETRGVPQRHEGDCQRNADAINIAVQSEDNSKSDITATGIFAFDSVTASVHEGSPHTGKAKSHM